MMGSMVAVKGMLSMKAEAMALTQRTMMMAAVRLPPETSFTQLAIIWIRPVSSAPAMTMNRPMKKTRVGHSTSFSSISTMSSPEMASSTREPIRAAMDTGMCRKPCEGKEQDGEAQQHQALDHQFLVGDLVFFFQIMRWCGAHPSLRP